MSLPELSTIHDTYLLLSRVARDRFAGRLAGKLLLRVGFDAAGVATVVAASVAGGATLCVEADGALLREGLRGGLCDFVVGDLDEALRILKNEVRRGLPVSVGLGADPAGCVAAMIERGVQPDLVAADAAEVRAACAIFGERGAVLLEAGAMPEAGTSLLCWSVARDGARTMPLISRMAAAALDEGRVDTPARRRWLEVAPRYLGRGFGSRQCVRMTREEAAGFIATAQAATPAATIRMNGVSV